MAQALEEEVQLALAYSECGDYVEAYKETFPGVKGSKAILEKKARAILQRPDVAVLLGQMKKDTRVLAAAIYKKHMVLGDTPANQMKAAKEYLASIGKEDREKDAFTRWCEIMQSVGAEIVIPPHEKAVKLTFESFITGEAHINLPLDSKLRLLEMAGAPWNDKDPNATVSELQVDVLGREDRELVVLGGSGVGKSALGGMIGLCELLLPGRNIAVVAALYKHVGHEFEYICKGFQKLFPGMLWRTAAPVFNNINRVKYENFHIETLWQTQARGYSVDTNEGAALLGSGFDLVICGEGDLIQYGIYNRKIKRAMDRRAMRTGPGYRTGRIAMFTTPAFGEGAASRIQERVMETTKDQPELAAVPHAPWAESTFIRTASVLENPAYDPAIYEATKKIMIKEDPDAFHEQYDGQIRRRSGVVLKEFNRDTHIIEMPPTQYLKEMRFVVGMDPGSQYGAVLIGMDRKYKKFILGEVYNEKQTVTDNVYDLKDMLLDVLGPVIGVVRGGNIEADFELIRERIDSFWVDRASEQKLELEEALDCNLDYGTFEVAGTLSSLREMFRDNELFVVETCEQWIRDAGRYSYKARKGLDTLDVEFEPRKKFDHLCDATRYAIFGGLDAAGALEVIEQPIDMQEAYQNALRESIDKDKHGIPQNPFHQIQEY